jgi:hypothetical protein
MPSRVSGGEGHAVAEHRQAVQVHGQHQPHTERRPRDKRRRHQGQAGHRFARGEVQRERSAETQGGDVHALAALLQELERLSRLLEIHAPARVGPAEVAVAGAGEQGSEHGHAALVQDLAEGKQIGGTAGHAVDEQAGILAVVGDLQERAAGRRHLELGFGRVEQAGVRAQDDEPAACGLTPRILVHGPLLAAQIPRRHRETTQPVAAGGVAVALDGTAGGHLRSRVGSTPWVRTARRGHPRK